MSSRMDKQVRSRSCESNAEPPPLTGKTAVVIGGGSVAPGWGIGKAVAVAFARSGASVAVADINLDAADETADIIKEQGGSAASFVVNASEEDSVKQVIDQALEKWGRIDVLHNNVGIGKAGDPEQTTAGDWRGICDANIVSLHICSQAVLPHMKAQRGGVILTTSSIAGLRHIGFPHLPYGVTKAAANHFTRLMAVEYASYGVRVNAIVVGLVDTPRIHVNLGSAYADSEEMVGKRNRQIPLGFMGSAWDVAHAAAFLASDRARYITGAELVVDGGLTATTR